MSYDFYIEIDAGGPEPLRLDPDFGALPDGVAMDDRALALDSTWRIGSNYTSNVSPIWQRCLTAAAERHAEAHEWMGDDVRALLARAPHLADRYDVADYSDRLCLRDLAGKRFDTIGPVLAEAVTWGVDHLDELRELDPGNGWGNAIGAIQYLASIEAFARAYPLAVLSISS